MSALVVDRSFLLEVCVSALPERRDLYSPADIFWLLENYHELDMQIGPRMRDDESVRVQANRPRHLDTEKLRCIRHADIDRALIWLSQLTNDPIAADAISGYYIEVETKRAVADRAPRQRRRFDIGGVAQWQGVTEQEINRRIHRGVELMASHLGWPSHGDIDN